MTRLKRVKLLSRVRLFATPWTVACQAPPSMGFSRQEYWSGLPFPSTGDLPNPGIEPRSPALQADSLPSEPPGNQAERPPNPLVTVEDSASVLLVLGPFRVPKSITARFYRRYLQKVFLMSKGVITLHSRPRQPPPSSWFPNSP